MTICDRCGEGSPDGQRFCGSCGSPLVARCPSCGAEAVPGKRFCADCGTPLGSGRTSESPLAHGTGAPPVSERRVCSVLFADLVGFTPLSEARDPEEVRELLSTYFATARTVVERYGGIVEKFIGDAVMAVWGTPVAREGDTEHAVRAGLELVAAVAALGADVGAPELTARAGVVTGEVAATIGAAGEGMVAGDAVNTAARVQSVAEPGSVLVDDTTRRLARAAVEFDEAREYPLRGKAHPEPLSRAVRVVSGFRGSQRVDGLEAPLIGRDVELRLVKDLFHACVERRTPRLLVVSGLAGVGKSRLGWEFEKYVDGLAGTVLWHRGRCLNYGEGVAFWALAEAFRARFGIAEEDPLDVAAAKLSAGLAALVPDPQERGYIAVRVGRLLGVPTAEDQGGALPREELYAGWRLFLERLATVEPVLLLLEDVQYADDGLLDFLDHLVDWVRDRAIYVVVFCRPELQRDRPGFGTGRYRTTLALDPLDEPSMQLLLETLVPGMSAPAKSAIATHAQGIPLFAVETVRALVDRDAVVPVEGVYTLVGEVGELSVPDNLHALLAARLDALDPQLRSLVADAAVMGSSFAADGLVAVSGRPESTVRAALQELVRREVLEISADSLSPQRGSYRFAQGMLRHVAYDTLSRRDRKARHLAVAAHLRQTFANDGDEVVDVVAQHYRDALAAVPEDPDSEALRAEVVALLVRSGERAQRMGAARAAAGSFTSAAQMCESPHDEAAELVAAELYERASRAGQLAGDVETATGRAERARALYLAQGQERAAARAQSLIGRALMDADRLSEARSHFLEALAVLTAQPDEDTVHVLRELATLEAFTGGTESDRFSTEALDLGQSLDVGPALMAELLTARSLVHDEHERPAQAAAYLREAARLAESAGATKAQATALNNLASIIVADDPVAATAAAQRAAELGRRTGARMLTSVCVANVVVADLAIGDWDHAAEVVTEAIEVDGLGDRPQLILYASLLEALRGELDVASLTAAVREPSTAVEDPQWLGMAAVIEAVVADAAGDARQALTHARQALSYSLGRRSDVARWGWPVAVRAAHALGDDEVITALLDPSDPRARRGLPPPLRAERTLAVARRSASDPSVDPADALAGMAAAVAGVRAVGSPYHLAHALLDHAELLQASAVAAGAAGEVTAAALVDEARLIGRRLGCGPLLVRCDRVRDTAGLAVGS